MIRLEDKIMDLPCEFCGIVRALVYCKSDAARLCLSCDGCVHNANPLARRHQRSLICDKCTLQPAIIRCVDEKLNLCQVCDCNGNGCSGLGHHRQAMDCYSGCPSMAELSRIWSVVLDPHCSSSSNAGWGRPNAPVPSTGLTNSLIPFNELETCAKFEPWTGPSSLILNYIPLYRDQASIFPEEPHQLPKGCSDFKELETNDGHDICEGITIEDVSLNFDNENTIFGSAQATPIKCYKDLGTMEKNSSVTVSDGPMDNALEVFSAPNLCFSRSSS